MTRAGLLFIDDGFQNLRDRQRFHIAFGFDEDAAIGRPIARPVRMVSEACAGPIDHHHHFGRLAGFPEAAALPRRRISSNGFIEILTLASSTPVSVALDADHWTL